MTDTYLVWCPPCQMPTKHVVDVPLAACTTCGEVRDSIPQRISVGSGLLDEPVVVELKYCDYCRSWKPVGHPVCTGDVTVACQERTEAGAICGRCPVCIAAQMADMERFGSPSELDIP